MFGNLLIVIHLIPVALCDATSDVLPEIEQESKEFACFLHFLAASAGI